ncbi:MAG: hypothetical protein MZV70_69200 [Desulfobacterales bacterium]|nr:hypothetical protein [Desulfobacterales bacterium]
MILAALGRRAWPGRRERGTERRHDDGGGRRLEPSSSSSSGVVAFFVKQRPPHPVHGRRGRAQRGQPGVLSALAQGSRQRLDAQVIVLLVITVAAAEAAVGSAIILLVHRRRRSIRLARISGRAAGLIGCLTLMPSFPAAPARGRLGSVFRPPPRPQEVGLADRPPPPSPCPSGRWRRSSAFRRTRCPAGASGLALRSGPVCAPGFPLAGRVPGRRRPALRSRWRRSVALVVTGVGLLIRLVYSAGYTAQDRDVRLATTSPA